MAGLFKQFGRWIDSEILQNPVAGAISPLITGYQLMSKTGLFKSLAEANPNAAVPKPPPDLTDQAVREAANRKKRQSMFGGRKSTFLTGPLGDRSAIPDNQKSILG